MVKKTFAVTPASKELRPIVAKELGIDPTPKWDTRAPAFASALVTAREIG
jgi:hypothetical protein